MALPTSVRTVVHFLVAVLRALRVDPKTLPLAPWFGATPRHFRRLPTRIPARRRGRPGR
jgi:hypothetical protein